MRLLRNRSHLLVSLPSKGYTVTIRCVEKRTEIISVRMTPADREKLREAALLQWPGAILTESAVMLSLARMAADMILEQKS